MEKICRSLTIIFVYGSKFVSFLKCGVVCSLNAHNVLLIIIAMCIYNRGI